MSSSTSSGFDLWEALDGLRENLAPRMTGRGERGDIRSSILMALTDGPKNGHQIIQTIKSRMPGGRTPNAGSVYPTLQLLADEGLVSGEQVDERKVYSLTEAGRAAADEAASAERGSSRGSRQWDDYLPRFGEHSAAVPKAGAKLAQAASVVAQSGTTEQKERAAAILDEARRKLYAILAED